MRRKLNDKVCESHLSPTSVSYKDNAINKLDTSTDVNNNNNKQRLMQKSKKSFANISSQQNDSDDPNLRRTVTRNAKLVYGDKQPPHPTPKKPLKKVKSQPSNLTIQSHQGDYSTVKSPLLLHNNSNVRGGTFKTSMGSSTSSSTLKSKSTSLDKSKLNITKDKGNDKGLLPVKTGKTVKSLNNPSSNIKRNKTVSIDHDDNNFKTTPPILSKIPKRSQNTPLNSTTRHMSSSNHLTNPNTTTKFNSMATTDSNSNAQNQKRETLRPTLSLQTPKTAKNYVSLRKPSEFVANTITLRNRKIISKIIPNVPSIDNQRKTSYHTSQDTSIKNIYNDKQNDNTLQSSINNPSYVLKQHCGVPLNEFSVDFNNSLDKDGYCDIGRHINYSNDFVIIPKRYNSESGTSMADSAYAEHQPIPCSDSDIEEQYRKTIIKFEHVKRILQNRTSLYTEKCTELEAINTTSKNIITELSHQNNWLHNQLKLSQNVETNLRCQFEELNDTYKSETTSLQNQISESERLNELIANEKNEAINTCNDLRAQVLTYKMKNDILIKKEKELETEFINLNDLIQCKNSEIRSLNTQVEILSQKLEEMDLMKRRLDLLQQDNEHLTFRIREFERENKTNSFIISLDDV